jgi:pyruvate/2-oxoglutarate dehydrogenase complex dihydrolipoamide acyltransferase (E2) component
VSEDRPQQTSAQREYQEYAATEAGEQPAADREPDVVLDVPVLNVGTINLEVRGLRAHVAVLAELANFVNLSVGVDARLDEVKLTIEDVEAQALLKVRLEHVRAILEKALETIAENPQILESLSRSVDRTAQQVGGAAREAVGEGGAVSQVAGGVGDTTRQAGEVVGRVGEGAQGAVGQVAGQGGQAARGAAEQAQGVVKATPSAERLAQQLGVDLSQIGGTGPGGYITVKDVRHAAQGR